MTVRSAPSLVGSVPPGRRGALLFHFDAEFPTMTALVSGTLTGRNFGWMPTERATAVAHIANVIRGDDGRGALARTFGGPYAVVLRGGVDVPVELRLPPHLRLNVARASDEQILTRVSQLVAAYVQSLAFIQHEDGDFDGSPFDVFLAHNALPRRPAPGQSSLAYSRTLRGLLAVRGTPSFVRPDVPHVFALHDQPFQFGPEELRGLETFLREPGAGNAATGGIGNCIACHPLPAFTDFRAHNTGIAQREYDRVHGAGAFATLVIPDLATRDASPDAWLPATVLRPAAAEPFRRQPNASQPGWADLGLWNIFANPDFANTKHQRRMADVVCRSLGRAECRKAKRDHARLLDTSVALFKMPGLRDLGHSAPYFHDGSLDSIERVLETYIELSALARAGAVRNAAPELADVRLAPEDVAPLAAFLRALNEDYE